MPTDGGLAAWGVPLPSSSAGSCASASVPLPLAEAPGEALPMRWVGRWGTQGLLPWTVPCLGPGAGWCCRPGRAPQPPLPRAPHGACSLCGPRSQRRASPPLLSLPALPNNGGPGSSGCSFEFKCSQPLVYKNNNCVLQTQLCKK